MDEISGCDATCAHWYSSEQIERYAGALIARDLEQRRSGREKYTVRQFIAQFRGLSGTDKQKLILRELGAAHMSLHQFFGTETEVNHRRMEKLLKLLQQHTRPVRPELLGVVGEQHLLKLMTELAASRRASNTLPARPSAVDCRMWSRSQPARSSMGRWQIRNAESHAHHRSELQRHTTKSVRDLQRVGGDGDILADAPRRGICTGHRRRPLHLPAH